MTDAHVCYWPTWTALPRRPWVLRGTDGSNWRVKDSLWSKRFDTGEQALEFAEQHKIPLCHHERFADSVSEPFSALR